MHNSCQKESAQETSEKNQSRSPGEMQFDVKTKKNCEASLCVSSMSTGTSMRTEKSVKRNAKAM